MFVILRHHFLPAVEDEKDACRATNTESYATGAEKKLGIEPS